MKGFFMRLTKRKSARLLFCFILIAGSLHLVSCSKEEVKTEDIALQAAKTYYDQLLHGDIDSYVEGTLHGDSIPEAYRQQLVLNMKMFLEQQRKNHKGIDSIRTIRATVDSTSHTANAFLTFCYSDSTKEEVIVPMIEKDGVWYMR